MLLITRCFTRVLLPSFLLATAVNSPGLSQDFRPLFNGKNLDGWVNVNTAPETWTVRDGMIVCSGFPTGVLRTTRQFQNYVLELEWRHIKEGGNAGLFLHSYPVTARGKPFTRSIEAQIMDGDHGDVFAIHGATMTPISPNPRGSMRAHPTENRNHPAGQWNHYRVESRDGVLSLSVNGKLVTQGVNTNPRRGYICLESEGSEVHFRNIRIHEMEAGPTPPDVIAMEAEGFRSLYNGLDFRGWKLASGSVGHWKVKDWILDYDGKSTAPDGERDLWTEQEFGNFELIVDWRQTMEVTNDTVPHILEDGSYALAADGSRLMVTVPDAGDSGIYLRGSSKAQINIWNWPIGSGEVWGYRTDQKLSAQVRRGATPIVKADLPIGEWNRFEIRLVGDRLTVRLNDQLVIKDAHLPGIPERGPIGLQHHGDPIQFANLYIRELD